MKPAELRKLIDSKKILLYRHDDDGDRSHHSHTLIMVTPRPDMYFTTAFNTALRKIKKQDDGWSDSDVYDCLRERGWELEIINLQDMPWVAS